MAGSPSSIDATAAPAGGSSYLPALLGVAAALGLWMLAQPVHDEAISLQQQIGISAQSRSLSSADAIADLERQADQSRDQRRAIEARLQVTEPAAVAHARVLHELRQRCAAAGIPDCTVRYVDEAAQANAPSAAALPAGSQATLAALGMIRSKAVISGQFRDMEFRKLLGQLENEQTGIWRVSALSVRGNRFELEAELITRPQRAIAGGGA